MHDQRDDYLAQRHAGLRTEAHIVFEWVKTATGCTPVTRQKIVRGNDSEVYRVETKEGHAFVIRIRHGGEVTFREEAWAIERCRQAGVRVPDVLLVDTMATETGEREVMVQRAVPGHPLADAAGSMSDEQLREALQEAGEELAKIHSIAAGGFYHYHIPHGWDFPD